MKKSYFFLSSNSNRISSSLERFCGLRNGSCGRGDTSREFRLWVNPINIIRDQAET